MIRTVPCNLDGFLDRLNSRSILSDEEQRQILDLPVRVKHAVPNEDFVSLGQQVEHSCFVLDGLVGRFDQNARGDRQITALHISGDMADLHSVVQPRATSALQALSTSTILEIPYPALRALASSYPAIAEAFWRDCTVDSMVLAQWVVNVGRRDGPARIAHLLCELACRYGAKMTNGAVTFMLPMTQIQLADAVGLTSVHVNRCLKVLEDAETTFRKHTVRIKDWDALADLGEFDRDYLQCDQRPDERIRLVQ